MSGIDRRRFLSGGVAVVAGGVLGLNSTPNRALAASTQRALAPTLAAGSARAVPAALAGGQTEITGSWAFQAASEIPGVTGEQLSSGTGLATLRPAVVPGTPLTSMIAAGDYPDPFYRHIVTDTVPDTLKDDDYWYCSAVELPEPIAGQRFWLRLDGVNYLAEVWFNGTMIGRIEGAFRRGIFDVTELVGTGGTGYLAVRIIKLDHSEGPLEPRYSSGVTRGGRNGGPTGVTLKNGPTFFCTAGWDWLPTIPDRDLGIIKPVSWFRTGPIRINEIHVDTDVADDLASAAITLNLSLDNGAAAAVTATVTVSIDGAVASHTATVPAGATTMTLTPADIPELALTNPKLWWPNGYGEPNRYVVTVGIAIGDDVSDEQELSIGVRKISYTAGGPDTRLSISVNNLPILVMGGNWGLDEALKRTPRSRIFDCVRLHRDANLNLIRNWNGQSTSEDFYAACDEYGILVWQDFFYSTEGPGPVNIERDVANIRECITNYRHHPSILLWCGGNEGAPPDELVNALDAAVAELDPKRACLTSSAGDTGTGALTSYSSGGPYHWVTPTRHFEQVVSSPVAFHNEIGSYSIPSLEFMRAMLPKTSWESPDDFWADRDANGNGGNGGGKGYIELTDGRYGEVQNLADFVRKSQMMNHECIKAIYESHAASMLGAGTSDVANPLTGVIMWMSHPAQPSLVWQMYSHDLETHSSFFAVQRGCRRINVIFNADSRAVVLVNHSAASVSGIVTIALYDLNGVKVNSTDTPVSSLAAASLTTVKTTIKAEIDAVGTDVCFVSLTFTDSAGVPLAENFYWHQGTGADDSYAALDTITPATIIVSGTASSVVTDQLQVQVQVTNTGPSVALMVHLQVYDINTGKRILPAYFTDNYLNVLPGQSISATVTVPGIDPATAADTVGIRVDGWKLDTENSTLTGSGCAVTLNRPALYVAPASKTFGVPGASVIESITTLTVSPMAQVYGVTPAAVATAAVTIPDGETAAGSVTFSEGKTPIGSKPLGANGQASLALPTNWLPVSHPITATFVPANPEQQGPSTSAPVAYTVYTATTSTAGTAKVVRLTAAQRANTGLKWGIVVTATVDLPLSPAAPHGLVHVNVDGVKKASADVGAAGTAKSSVIPMRSGRTALVTMTFEPEQSAAMTRSTGRLSVPIPS